MLDDKPDQQRVIEVEPEGRALAAVEGGQVDRRQRPEVVGQIVMFDGADRAIGETGDTAGVDAAVAGQQAIPDQPRRQPGGTAQPGRQARQDRGAGDKRRRRQRRHHAA